MQSGSAPVANPAVTLPSEVPSTIIVGGGLAGLFAALKLAPQPVTLISPAPLGEAASSTWAQGGIAAAVGLGDTIEAHAADTVRAGAGLVDADVALSVARDAADRIDDLVAFGVPFDRDASGAFLQSREAAHSEPRVVRVTGDRAGAAIMQALIRKVIEADHVRIVEGFSAEDLIVRDGIITGLVLAAISDPNRRFSLSGATDIILATGGVGGLYATTTNPAASTGRGIAMAARAGAVIADAEFVQFHPTAISVPSTAAADPLAPAPLASEALRGEGATLVNSEGVRFLLEQHSDAELAPRDIVARAVFAEIADGRGAFLDCREAIGAAFENAFPTIHAMCAAAGIDPSTDLIPVRPAEHYHMGGVKTDARGATTVSRLWAIGEVAATGLHGANRLASNSLLEAVVFAARTAEAVKASRSPASMSASVDALAATDAASGASRKAVDPELRRAAQITIRAIMDRDVGVVRNRAGLAAALSALAEIEASADGDREIENMAIAARFIAESALRRKANLGAHYRSDALATESVNSDAPRRTTMTLAGLNMRAQLTSGELLGELMQSNAVT